jgi:DNA-binding MarR family transcriptional regulator
MTEVSRRDRTVQAIGVLARLSRLLDAAECELTVPQYRMLSALRAGGERSARLAARLAVRRPTVTALADGLIAAGYANRTAEAGDRRIVRLELTPAGRAVLDRTEAAYLDRIGPLLTAVPQPDPLLDGLIAVGAALDRSTTAAAGRTEAAR